MVNDQVGTPGAQWAAVAEIAVADGNRAATGVTPGLNVTQVVTDVERAMRRDAQQTAGVQYGQSGGLGLRGRVTTDDTGRARQSGQPAR